MAKLDTPGFVYAAQENCGLVKIGHTKRNPSDRISQLNCDHGVNLNLICAGYVDRCCEYEYAAHKRFSDYNVCGEYFDIPASAVRYFLEKYCGADMDIPEDREKMLNVRLPENLITEVKVYCAQNKITVKDFMAGAAISYIASREGGI